MKKLYLKYFCINATIIVAFLLIALSLTSCSSNNPVSNSNNSPLLIKHIDTLYTTDSLVTNSLTSKNYKLTIRTSGYPDYWLMLVWFGFDSSNHHSFGILQTVTDTTFITNMIPNRFEFYYMQGPSYDTTLKYININLYEIK